MDEADRTCMRRVSDSDYVNDRRSTMMLLWRSSDLVCVLFNHDAILEVGGLRKRLCRCKGI